MQNDFIQTEFVSNVQKLFTDELNWWNQKLTGAFEQVAADGEKLGKAGRELFEHGFEAQSKLAVDLIKHGQTVVERQVEMVRSLFEAPEKG